ncbi:MAG: EAL domain-containing protein [Pseudomonadota bacterium]
MVSKNADNLPTVTAGLGKDSPKDTAQFLQRIKEMRQARQDRASLMDSSLVLAVVSIDSLRDWRAQFGEGLAQVLKDILVDRIRDRCAQETAFSLFQAESDIMFCVEIGKQNNIREVMFHLKEIIERPVSSGNLKLAVKATMGMVLDRDPSAPAESLIANAQTALVSATRAISSTRMRFYTPQMGRAAQRRALIENDFPMALSKGEVFLHYQPVYDIKSDSFVGVEALSRWNHTDLGMVSPSEFIPIAEESSSITDLTHHSLEQVIKQIEVWDRQDFNVGYVFVNMSTRVLADSGFLRECASLLRSTERHQGRIGFEITEESAVDDVATAIESLNTLRDHGVMIALDDFGVAYASMHMLHKLPIDVVKIDQSFIRGMALDDRSRALVSSTVAMVHGLGMQVVAEGVEDRFELDLLRDMDCDRVQGYFLSRPQAYDGLVGAVSKALSVLKQV